MAFKWVVAMRKVSRLEQLRSFHLKVFFLSCCLDVLNVITASVSGEKLSIGRSVPLVHAWRFYFLKNCGFKTKKHPYNS